MAAPGPPTASPSAPAPSPSPKAGPNPADYDSGAPRTTKDLATALSTNDTIIWKLHLQAPPDRVYQLLTTDEGRASFWALSAVETDGVITFVAKNDVTWTSEILERVENQRLVLDYNGRVEFDLTPDGEGGTDLTLTYTEFDPAIRDDALPGWLNVLFPLKARADFDIDLRNPHPNRDWAAGYADH